MLYNKKLVEILFSSQIMHRMFILSWVDLMKENPSNWLKLYIHLKIYKLIIIIYQFDGILNKTLMIGKQAKWSVCLGWKTYIIIISCSAVVSRRCRRWEREVYPLEGWRVIQVKLSTWPNNDFIFTYLYFFKFNLSANR